MRYAGIQSRSHLTVTGCAQAFYLIDLSQLLLAREEKLTLSNMTKSPDEVLMEVNSAAVSCTGSGLDPLQGEVHCKVSEDHVGPCAFD